MKVLKDLCIAALFIVLLVCCYGFTNWADHRKPIFQGTLESVDYVQPQRLLDGLGSWTLRFQDGTCITTRRELGPLTIGKTYAVYEGFNGMSYRLKEVVSETTRGKNTKQIKAWGIFDEDGKLVDVMFNPKISPPALPLYAKRITISWEE